MKPSEQATRRGREIRAELKRRGVPVTEIARRVERTDTLVHHVISGRWDSARVRAALAEALEFDPWQRWPDGGDDTAAAG